MHLNFAIRDSIDNPTIIQIKFLSFFTCLIIYYFLFFKLISEHSINKNERFNWKIDIQKLIKIKKISYEAYSDALMNENQQRSNMSIKL